MHRSLSGRKGEKLLPDRGVVNAKHRHQQLSSKIILKDENLLPFLLLRKILYSS